MDVLAWLEAGGLSPLDVRFAEAMVRLADEPSNPLVTLGAALASRAVQRGHVCADLMRLASEPLLDRDGVVIRAEPPFALEPMVTALKASVLVSDGRTPAPLVLDGQRLFLRRYFDYEQRLARALRARLEPYGGVDDALLDRGLGRLFPAASEQREAAEVAVRGQLAIISGGPGTGKTTTVAKFLALLIEQARDEQIRIQLVAPTGKAAQRLGESLDATAKSIDVSPSVRAQIPRQATTIHRALGYQPRSPTRFRHGVNNPLSVDVVVADEASMIDLALMTKLVEAVPQGARLVLLGDKAQLASVEAGAVLGDMWDASALSPRRALLTKSYRFAEKSGIAVLARAMSQGDSAGAMAVLSGEIDMPYGMVALHPAAQGLVADPAVMGDVLEVATVNGFRPYLTATDPAERLERLAAFRILCAHRRGPAGVEAANRATERVLTAAGLLQADGDFYDGRPIMITANDHQLGLFNGDVGVIGPHVTAGGRGRRAFFTGPREVRAIPLGRLPPHETAFAMTVHKAQGSEMDRVAFVLPTDPSPILSRELLYTAVTRARSQVDIFGSGPVLRSGLQRRIERASGLAHVLGQVDPSA